MRFREKFKQEQAKKVYYTKTLSASRRRIVVTGGKDLKSSAAYTPQFARAILRMWRECWEIGVDAIRMDHASMDYRQLWGCVFEGSATMEERSIMLCSHGFLFRGAGASHGAVQRDLVACHWRPRLSVRMCGREKWPCEIRI